MIIDTNIAVSPDSRLHPDLFKFVYVLMLNLKFPPGTHTQIAYFLSVREMILNRL